MRFEDNGEIKGKNIKELADLVIMDKNMTKHIHLVWYLSQHCPTCHIRPHRIHRKPKMFVDVCFRFVNTVFPLSFSLFHNLLNFHRCLHCSLNCFTTTIVIISWEFLMFYQIFLLPQVKRSLIISNKTGIYELPHELPNDLTLRILGN